MNVLATVGAATLLTALASAIAATVMSTIAARTHNAAAAAAGRRAILASAGLVSTAFGVLAYALLTNDFSLEHVASVSSRNMETLFKWASLYSGQPGSLLFWTWTLSLFMAGLVLVSVRNMGRGGAHVVAVAGLVLAAFLIPLVFMASPFRVSAFTPADGVGLNPLLVDSGMLIHPPFLLAGLVSTAVPFVLATGALLSGRIDGAWIRHARAWALLAFVILSVGNLLGGWWAYTVLGWGGYWGWDPVENSALLPLLPLIAFLHTIMVQERRGMMKMWNLVLAISAFVLAVFGTFNVRSGLVSSVHSFAQSDVGPYFLAVLGVTAVASLGLLAWRSPRLETDDADLDSLLSRESMMLLNSYVLTAITLVVLGGTLFPVFSELFRGTRLTVGPPFFNQVVGPLLIVLVALTAVGVVVPWRRAAGGTLARRFRVPLAVTAVVVLPLVALGMRDPFAIAGVASAVLLIAVTLREYAIGTRGLRTAQGRSWPGAFVALFERDRRRYGGYLVHLGVAVMAIAIVGSNIYQERTRAVIAPGEQFAVGDYTIHYDDLAARSPGINGIDVEIIAELEVFRGSDRVGRIEPGRRIFTNFPSQPVALVAIQGNAFEDLYVFMQGWDENLTAEFQAFVNPLIRWLWTGAAIYTLGGVLAFAPAASGARERREEMAAGGEVPGSPGASGNASGTGGGGA